MEVELRAALVSEGEPIETRTQESAEDRELRELRSKVVFADYVGAAMEQRAVGGAALEYNQALKIPANQFPLSMLAPDLEQRATTNTDTATMPKRWLDRLLAGSAAERLGITFESVEPGVATYPVTTAGATGAQRGRTEAAADTAWTVGTTDMKPKRNAVSLTYSMEDAARLPGLDDALVRDLRIGLMEAVDKAVFLGDDGANENGADITGLNTASNVVEKTVTQANKVKADQTLKAFVELVDGIHAESVGQLRLVVSVGSNVLWSTTIHNNAADNQTVGQFLMASGLNWTVRGGIDTATANGDWGAFVGRGRGIDGAGVAAVWSQGELIRDPYSSAKKGEVILTLNYLWDFSLPRATNFARLKYVT